jgi:hypothetical protein
VVAWWANVSIGSWSDFNIFTPEILPEFAFETQLPTDYSNAVGTAALAASEDGFFVGIFNMMKSDGDTSDTNIFIKKFDNAGNTLINDMRINSDTLDNCKIVDVLIDDTNDIIFVSWYTEGDIIFEERDFYTRQLDFNLNPLTNDILIFENIDSTAVSIPRIARMSGDRIFAVWSREYYASQKEVIGTYFNFDGSNQVGPFTVNTYSSNGDFDYPNITSVVGGGVFVVWSAEFAQYEGSIWGRRFDTNGQPIDTVEVLLTVPDINGDGYSELQNVGSIYQNEQTSDYILIWNQKLHYPSPNFMVSCRFLNSDIQPISDTIRVSDMEGSVEFPKAAFISDDSVFTVWSGYYNIYYEFDVFGKIAVRPVTKIENNSQISPDQIALNVYPNPFNERISISFTLSYPQNIKLDIYDILGRKLAQLTDTVLQPGIHKALWEANNYDSGIYFIRLSSSEYKFVRKITLLK